MGLVSGSTDQPTPSSFQEAQLIVEERIISGALTEILKFLKSLSWVNEAEPNTTTYAGIRLRSPSKVKDEAFQLSIT
jgi:hypothetical protein